MNGASLDARLIQKARHSGDDGRCIADHRDQALKPSPLRAPYPHGSVPHRCLTLGPPSPLLKVVEHHLTVRILSRDKTFAERENTGEAVPPIANLHRSVELVKLLRVLVPVQIASFVDPVDHTVVAAEHGRVAGPFGYNHDAVTEQAVAVARITMNHPLQ